MQFREEYTFLAPADRADNSAASPTAAASPDLFGSLLGALSERSA